MRIFIALYLKDDALDKLRERQTTLSKRMRAKFTDTDQLHLTLAFFPDIDDAQINTLKERCYQMTIPSQLHTDTVEMFGKRKDIVSLKINETKELSELAQQCRAVSFHHAKNPFTPHITLARRAKPFYRDFLNDLTLPPTLNVDHLALVHSTLTSDGAIHNKIWMKKNNT